MRLGDEIKWMKKSSVDFPYEKRYNGMVVGIEDDVILVQVKKNKGYKIKKLLLNEIELVR